MKGPRVMTERIACPQCGAAYRVGATLSAGRKLACSKCGARFRAGEAGAAKANGAGSGEAGASCAPEGTPTIPRSQPPGPPTAAGDPALGPGAPTGLVGRTLGGCRIEAKLGQGGMGAVYRAHHLALDIPVAVKILPPHFAEGNPDFVERFIREARSAARLQHQNIVGVLNVGEESGLHYIVMQFVDGQSLQQMLQKRGSLRPDEALRIGAEVCDALAYAERCGIIHRDIKPDNIMLASDGGVRLADMGLAKEVGDESGMTQSGMAMGTPHYMAPEQATNARDADHRSDIYALGCTLFRLVTGEAPYDGESMFTIMTRHASDPVPDARERNAAVPPGLATVLRKAMAKKPAARYQRAGDMAADLRRVANREAPLAAAGDVEADTVTDGAAPSPLGAKPSASRRPDARQAARKQRTPRKQAAAEAAAGKPTNRRRIGYAMAGAGVLLIIVLLALAGREDGDGAGQEGAAPDGSVAAAKGDGVEPDAPPPGQPEDPDEADPAAGDAAASSGEASDGPQEPGEDVFGAVRRGEWVFLLGDSPEAMKPHDIGATDHAFRDGVLSVRLKDARKAAAIANRRIRLEEDFAVMLEVRNARAVGLADPHRASDRFLVILDEDAHVDRRRGEWKKVVLRRKDGRMAVLMDGRIQPSDRRRGKETASGYLWIAVSSDSPTEVRRCILHSGSGPLGGGEAPHRDPDRREPKDARRPPLRKMSPRLRRR